MENTQEDPLIEALERADLVINRESNKEVAEPQQRTFSVGLLAVLMFISWAWVLPFAFFAGSFFQGDTMLPGTLYALYLAAVSAVGVVTSIAAWLLRRWSVWVYGAIAAIHQIVLLITGDWNVVLLIIPLAVFAFGVSQVRNMT